jgi:hypothetical protein
VALEGVHVSGPEAAKWFQPDVEFLKRFGPEAIKPALRVYRGLNKTSVTEHAEMPGHGGLRQAELALDLSHRVLRGDEEAQDGPAVRLRQNFENGLHLIYIRYQAYASKCIFQKAVRTNAASRHNGP